MPARRFDGQELRRARRARELSQEALGRAEGVGVEQPTVAKWESGTTFPEPERLPAIARALGEKLDTLFPRDGEPDLADLRCDAGYPQKKTGELIGAKSHIPVSNAERGVRRLNAAYVPRLAEAYGVTEKKLQAAQDRSFGVTPTAPVDAPPAPRTLAEKLTYLLETTFPSDRPTDAQIAAAVNAHAGVDVISADAVEALRTGTPPPSEVLDGLAAGVVLEGLAEFFGITPLYFQSDEELERQVADAISLLALRGSTDDFALAARGGQGGLDPAMIAKINALVAEVQQKAGPHR
ncbi:helix-turn-helix domain-containing protein [Kitasatospora sp. NPDC058190]|uniref:helix-turn-helix domain-containing protein n=1 Tax=Kitasatospora sp. NPDC058190 TaxID=3346371 RepID=UPI0036DBF138